MRRPAILAKQRKLLAYVLPMLLFVLLLGIAGALKRPAAPLWRSAPEYWIYPLQTLLCGALLITFRRQYEFLRPVRPLFAIAIALLVFVVWIAPQQFLHYPARLAGFDPELFARQPSLYWTILLLRFLRLVIVVPLVEEIFWRGFLLRYLINENFIAVSFGTFSWLSFAVVTLAFGFSHLVADWPAFIAGALYNLVAYRTKSLQACVLAHSLTNFALGCWVVATRQWGFW